jgi:hypothetical protein
VARDCKKEKGPKVGGNKDKHYALELDVTIGGALVRAIIDTGSSVNLLPSSIADFLEANQNGVSRITGRPVRLSGAFGDESFVSRRLKATVVFSNDVTRDSLSAASTFLVSDALGEGKALIGLPLLCNLRASVSLAGRRPVLTLRGEGGRRLRVRLSEVGATASVLLVSPDDPTAWSWGDKADDGLKRAVLGAAEAYPSLFAEGAAPPATPLVEGTVKLKPDAVPVFRRPYPMSPTHREFLKIKIKELEAGGVVERISGCAWASPAFLVPKPGGDPTLEKDMRLVVDLTAVNKAALWEPQPTPDMRDIVTVLDGKIVLESRSQVRVLFRWRRRRVVADPRDLDARRRVCVQAAADGLLELRLLSAGARGQGPRRAAQYGRVRVRGRPADREQQRGRARGARPRGPRSARGGERAAVDVEV